MSTLPPATDDASLLWLATAVAKRRRGVLLIVLGAMLLTIPFTLLRSRKYTSVASFMAIQRSTQGAQGVASIAAQFGLSAGGLDGVPTRTSTQTSLARVKS